MQSFNFKQVFGGETTVIFQEGYLKILRKGISLKNHNYRDGIIIKYCDISNITTTKGINKFIIFNLKDNEITDTKFSKLLSNDYAILINRKNETDTKNLIDYFETVKDQPFTSIVTKDEQNYKSINEEEQSLNEFEEKVKQEQKNTMNTLNQPSEVILEGSQKNTIKDELEGNFEKKINQNQINLMKISNQRKGFGCGFIILLICVLISVIIIISSNKTYSFESLASKNNASQGVLNSSYPLNPSGGFSIVEIHKYKQVTVNNESLKNVIVLKCVTDYTYMKNFLDNHAFLVLLNKKNHQYSDINTYIKNGDDYVYVILEANKDISDYNYLLIGGFKNSDDILFQFNSTMNESLSL